MFLLASAETRLVSSATSKRCIFKLKFRNRQDRPYFQLLWRDLKCERQPDVNESSRVFFFGKNAAPMESQFVAHENARRNEPRYPLADETVLKSTHTWMIPLTVSKTTKQGLSSIIN